ncbi:MAG: putative DNA binding domain-containing protein [Chryseobacterium sp.]|jgi:ATP-dependent DNA helicase RecG|uniref:RNA-binding domain-containing protein n=1 Tax=Chryseobacterium sp. TaxID=1871047 RepID=UPI00281E68DF|nr:RNA-binding domain-containing protein [Chryseobacterium sp.]MDR2238107.1 putative DNA binding domain-containing protein [Chryseobacterium sp.]
MALPINIENLINDKAVESVRIEFKRGWNPEEVIHTICAFANDVNEYGSGYLIIGIDEKDGTPILPPCGLQANQVDKIQKEFIELCFKIHPNIFPTIEPIEFQEQLIIVIWVTTGEERPYSAPSTLGGKAQRKIYVRPASLTIPANSQFEARLRELSMSKHFDDKVNYQASIDDLDLGLIQAYLKETKSKSYNETLKLSLSDIAINLQIARGTKENIKPLNVGLMMFSQNPEKYFEGCYTNLVEFENEAGTKYSQKKFQGPIHIQIRQIMEYLSSNIIKEFVRKDASKMEAEKFTNYPYQALEEVIVNSLYHRGYDNPNPNEIRIYKRPSSRNNSEIIDDRRIEIISYPGPMPPVDEKALVTFKIPPTRKYRNLKLGEWLKGVQLAEKFATGIPTLVDSLEENGSPKPILSMDEERSHFLVVIYIHPYTPEEVNDPMDEIEAFTLSNNQQIILEKILNEPIFETEIESLFDKNINADLDFFIANDLVGVKQSEKSKIFFITTRGKNALKNSF